MDFLGPLVPLILSLEREGYRRMCLDSVIEMENPSEDKYLFL